MGIDYILVLVLSSSIIGGKLVIFDRQLVQQSLVLARYSDLLGKVPSTTTYIQVCWISLTKSGRIFARKSWSISSDTFLPNWAKTPTSNVSQQSKFFEKSTKSWTRLKRLSETNCFVDFQMFVIDFSLTVMLTQSMWMIRSCKHEFTQRSTHVASFKPSLHFYKFMTCLIGNVLYFEDCPLWLCASLLPFPLSRIDFSWSTFCPVCMLMHNMKDKMVLNSGEHLLLQGLSPNQFSKRVCPNNSLMPRKG